MTVVFADVVGSTAMGEQLDSEAVRGLMMRYFEAMRAVITRHGGQVEKFIGDAVMGVFGLPHVHEDDALRAVRAAVDMRAGLDRLNTEVTPTWGIALQLRTGVNTGEVTAGSPGTSTLITGDPVNLAARLEQAAGPGEILLGPATYRLVRDAVVAEQAPPLTLKGKAEPVAPWRLDEVVEGVRGHARRFDTAFVGRTHERGLLQWAFERVSRERTCHLVTVLGPAGAGKTRLVNELLTDLGERAKVVTGHCLAYGEAITYWPVAQIVRQATNVTAGDDAAEAFDKLRSALGPGESAQQVAEQLAGLIGLGDHTEGDVAWAVRKALEALAQHRPVVIVMEDLHWAEPTLLDLVEHVADWSRDAPILVVAVARPELLDIRPSWGGGKVNATSLLLEPLPEEDARALLDALLGDQPVDDAVRRRLVNTAAGNPLFLEELLAMLDDEGLLGGDELATDRLDRLPLPDSIQGLLTARLDSVDPPERDTLDRASVVGEVFTLSTAVALTPPAERHDVPRRVRALVRKELVRIERSIDEEVFAFRHLLIRDAVYAALSKQARADLHERVADLMTGAAAPPTGEFDGLVGYHLEQAVRYRTELRPDDPAAADLSVRAAGYLAPAGCRALARGDMPAAVSLLRRGTGLMPAGAEGRAGLLIDLAKALIETGDTAGAKKALETAEVDASGNPVDRMRVRLSRLELASNVDLSGWVDAARTEAERAIPLLTEWGDELGLAKAWGLLAEVRYLHGAIAASEDAFRRHGDHGRRAGGEREEAEAAAALAWTAVEGPLPVPEAIARCAETLRRFDGHRSVEARTWRALALLHAMRGEYDRAHDYLTQSIEAFTDLGQRYWLADTSAVAGRVARLAGDRAAAERAFRASAEQLERIGDATYLPLARASLSLSLPDDAAEEAALLAERCLAAAEPDDVMAQILGRLADAQRHRRSGELPKAVARAAEAADLAAETDILDLQGTARATLGRLEALAGLDQEARSSLEGALGSYERKGNLVSADEVRDDLARLSPPRAARGGDGR